jgi:predicted lipid carrier protein YhbT
MHSAGRDRLSETTAAATNGDRAFSLPSLLGGLMRPLPLFPIQPILRRMVRDVARRRPELFDRLGPHIRSTFIIEISEFPFALLLRPDPAAPELVAVRRGRANGADAVIRGPFRELFRVIDGRGDSDALFFSRDIRISGDTEAAVCLRNALDDLDGSIVGDLATMGGALSVPVRLAVAGLRAWEGRQ